eukprot:2980056-Pleurochrysis_carterae.AAC.1
MRVFCSSSEWRRSSSTSARVSSTCAAEKSRACVLCNLRWRAGERGLNGHRTDAVDCACAGAVVPACGLWAWGDAQSYELERLHFHRIRAT